jgi:hypothetical protein
MKIRYCSIIIVLFVSHILVADTWKVLWYMDSTDALSDMAIKNMTDMMRGNPNDEVDIVIQLHAYHNVALRYTIIEESLIFLEEIPLSGTSQRDFIDAAYWAFADNTADHLMLIFANHGWGILDPEWNPLTHQWEADFGGLKAECLLKKNRRTAIEEHKKHRGFMFSASCHTYLNNQDLIESLATIKETILDNKKIDILAFDTCMGDMFEVAYAVAPYADYLIGNQSCALLDGFDYQGVVQVFNEGPTPREACVALVEVFDTYYKKYDKAGIYTHAAIDLSQMYAVNRLLDTVVASIMQMPELKPILVIARDESPRFCLWPIYTDLVAFCKIIEKEMNMVEPSAALDTLRTDLHNLYDAVAALGVARCGGFSTEGCAYGIAIYLPPTAIDSSYYKTVFAQEAAWINLLKLMPEEITCI